MGHSFFHAAADDFNESYSAKEEPQLRHFVHAAHHKNLQRYQQQSSADTNAAITEYRTTISLIAQVDVDTDGSILSTQVVTEQPSDVSTTTVPASATLSWSSSTVSTTYITSQDVLAPSTSSAASSTFTMHTVGSNSSTTPTASPETFLTMTYLATTNSTTASLTATSSFPASPLPPLVLTASYESLPTLASTDSLNSSSSATLIVPSPASSLLSSFTPSFISSSASAFISSSATSFVSRTRPTQTSSESFSSTFHSSSQSATSVSGGVFSAGPTGTSASSAATSTATSRGNGTSHHLTAPTGTVIAGVFGGLAGTGLLLVVVLILVKWYKRKLASNRAVGGSSDEGARASAAPKGPPPPEGMYERARFAIPAGLANLGSFNPNRMSRQTMGTVSSTAGSEQGFVRVSGRKIQSVLESGGDGYGDPAKTSNANMNVDGASYLQDSRGMYGGSESGSPITPVARRQSGIANWRPSPARTPIIERGAFLGHEFDQLPPRPDGGEHPRPSYEGSNAGSLASGSRFTEAV